MCVVVIVYIWKSADGYSVCDTRGTTIGQYPHTTISFNNNWSSLETVAEWRKIENEKQGPIYEPCVAMIIQFSILNVALPSKRCTCHQRVLNKDWWNYQWRTLIDGKAIKKVRSVYYSRSNLSIWRGIINDSTQHILHISTIMFHWLRSSRFACCFYCCLCYCVVVVQKFKNIFIVLQSFLYYFHSLH